MSSSSSRSARPTGRHHAPRKGRRSLTNRRIVVVGERRDEIDLHYLAKALLGLAQDQYDAARASAPAGPQPPHVPHSEAETPSVGPARGRGHPRPDTGGDGRES